jgi:hypothetical protein
MFIEWLARFDFNASAQHGAVFDHEAFRLQITSNITGAPELDLFAANNFAVYVAAHDHFARKDVGLHFAIRADSQAAVAQIHFPFDVAVDKEIFAAGNFTLDANALTDAGGSLR